MGNDVVDLAEPGAAGKARDRRFLERVCTAEERAALLSARHPTLVLWLLWAAKESAFKAESKRSPGCRFSPREWALASKDMEGFLDCDLLGGRSGCFRFAGRELTFLWRWSPEYVHCLCAGSSEGAPTLERLEKSVRYRICRSEMVPAGSLSAREEEEVHSAESREVRLLAKSLLAGEPGGQGEVEILRERAGGGRLQPPRLWVGGRAITNVDLSLSHDGRYLAAAVALSHGGGRGIGLAVSEKAPFYRM